MPLNEPYATWFREVVGKDAPEEQTATCDHCIMCHQGHFLPDLKCCGYMPAIPNFQAGRALAAGGLGAQRIRHRQATALATPTYLMPTPDEADAYAANMSRFARNDRIRCPYVTEDARCAIWAFRNAVCATWFCRHDKGAVGEALWDAATDLFTFAEQGLAVLAAGESYEASAEAATQISWAELRQLGGSELASRERALQDAWAQWSATPH